MAEYDADIDALIVFRCKHNQWLKWTRVCPQCHEDLLSKISFNVLDMRDEYEQRAFLRALKEQGVPCG